MEPLRVTISSLQVDLRHQEEEQGTNIVNIGVDLSEFYMSVEWDILAVPAIRNVKYYTCCDEPYLDITFNITMRRKTLFYTVNLIIPCMGISFLTVLVFYLPSDSGEKVSSKSIKSWTLLASFDRPPIFYTTRLQNRLQKYRSQYLS